MKILVALFDFKLKKRAGDQIIRWIYSVVGGLLTIAAVVTLIGSVVGYYDARTTTGETQALRILAGTLPAYALAMLLHRLFFEACYLAFRILIATEKLRSASALQLQSLNETSENAVPSNTNAAKAA